jgi:hypothetical protein
LYLIPGFLTKSIIHPLTSFVKYDTIALKRKRNRSTLKIEVYPVKSPLMAGCPLKGQFNRVITCYGPS